jgi:putative ubiquitin-RnfH superfamily antitoxin RatB of RatAB toxin-antitoxin module
MPSCCARRRYIQDRQLSDAPLRIEIAYAEPQRGIVKTLHLPAGSRVADALRLAALDPDFTGVDLANSALGIFGRLIRTDEALKEGDRIEIYRPLAADPKVARRARAKQARRKP